MKKLFGLTFEQLNTSTPELINRIHTEYEIGQVMQNLQDSGLLTDKDQAFLEKFMAICSTRIFDLFSEVCTQRYYNKLKSVCDTEDRFNMAADIFDDMAGISAKIHPLVGSIMMEFSLLEH